MKAVLGVIKRALGGLPEDPLLSHSDYFLKLRARFADQCLAIEEDVEFNEWRFDIVARHVRYDVVAVPVYLEELFLVSEFGSLSSEEFPEFCASGWAYAESIRTPRSSVERGLRLPPLARFVVEAANVVTMLFLHLDLHNIAGIVLCVYVVAIAEEVDRETVEWVRNAQLPRREMMSRAGGVMIPLVYESGSGDLNYFQKIPMLGNAFYREFKKVIKKRLLP
jgi:hypothetical protein